MDELTNNVWDRSNIILIKQSSSEINSKFGYVDKPQKLNTSN